MAKTYVAEILVNNSELTPARQLNLRITDEMYQELDKRRQALKFNSVEEYVVSILQREVNRSETQAPFSKEDEDKIKQNLQALGYL